MTAARLATALLLVRPGGLTIKASLAWLAVLAAAVVLPFHSAFFGRHPFAPGLHTAISVNQALMRTYCGRSGPVSPAVDVYELVRQDPRLLRQPFANTIVAKAGSIEAYCSGSSPNFLNNENSLMLLMRLGMRLIPRLSPAGLGRWLGTLHLLFVLLFVYVALRCGSPVLLTAVVLAVLCSIFWTLDVYHVYAFFIPILLLMPAVYVAALRSARLEVIGVLSGVSAVAGVLTGFCVNVRSSYLPTFALMFVVFLLALRRGRLGDRRRVLRVLAALACFALGFLMFNRIFIRPLEEQQTLGYNYSYHPIAHPLVLSLGLPAESRLTQREGIVWDDSVGLVLARRLIPDVNYLTPGYEKALLLYYIKLWMLYPREMLGIYETKLQVAGAGAFAVPGTDTEHFALSRAISIAGRVHSGGTLLAIFIVLFCATTWGSIRRNWPLALLVSLLSLAAVMMMLEAAIIYPMFQINYHSYLLFFIAGAELLVVQSMVEAAAWAVTRRIPGRDRAQGAPSEPGVGR